MPVFFFPVQIPNFTPNPGLHMSMSLWSPPNGLLYIHNIPSRFIPMISFLSGHWWGGWGVAGCAREVRCAKLGEGVDSNVWFCAGVRNAILAQDIYCTKPNPEPNAHSSSRVCKGIGNWAPRSTWEYDFATAMAIWPLTQLLTCKMVSSILVAMIWLKVASTTWVSLPITPSTESTNREKIRWSKQYCPCFSCLMFSHQVKSVSISSGLQVSMPASPNLTPMIASIWNPVGPGLTCPPMFMEHSLYDAPPPQICCGPSKLGVCFIISEGRSLVCQGGWSCHVSHCDIQ